MLLNFLNWYRKQDFGGFYKRIKKNEHDVSLCHYGFPLSVLVFLHHSQPQPLFSFLLHHPLLVFVSISTLIPFCCPHLFLSVFTNLALMVSLFTCPSMLLILLSLLQLPAFLLCVNMHIYVCVLLCDILYVFVPLLLSFSVSLFASLYMYFFLCGSLSVSHTTFIHTNTYSQACLPDIEKTKPSILGHWTYSERSRMGAF